MSPESTSSLEQEITAQTEAFNQLRLSGAPQNQVDQAKKALGELKKQLAIAKGAVGKERVKDKGKAQGIDKDGAEQGRMLLKTAKGTRDYGPSEMFCRLHIEQIVKDVFLAYGGSCLDTPVFERKDVLTGKYGEDQKLIFDLMDQGGEQLALRYDHTVPLARWLAMNGGVVGGGSGQAKIWQVGKVYRRDNPVMSKGRMREFSQADFDIAGQWDTMIPDAELISLTSTVLTRLDVGEFTIKLNHRKILDGIFEVCGVPPEKIRTISSAVDKLDKMAWADVKKEMTEEKGLEPTVADKIGEYVKHKGKESLLEQLLADPVLTANANAKQGLDEMRLLFAYLQSYKMMDKISFDLSLARGLDYYTGIIYEAIVEASAPPAFQVNANANPAPAKEAASSAKKQKEINADADEEVDESTVGVGSIAAGGRYDNLVGMFTAAAAGDSSSSKGKEKATSQLPCVGVSIGMDRIFALVWTKWVEKGMRSKSTMCYVMAAGDGLLKERMELSCELREAGIQTDFLAKAKPKLPAQFAAGERDEVPFAIILGADELREGLVTVKEQNWEFIGGKKVKIESSSKGVKVKRDELVSWIKGTRVYEEWASGRW
ncbi:hypothetical protein AMATHDRAFT_69300 [Amanita thiersii Skay4041]|uniref:histidine--tRNA ligase n=1 Tax=Amanita thiersii Skay4041 TaxID=703135 RepID=A0A2A9NG79_9AGAR|nr:hypothetical protein AMATHDRAFT_69300 [Amanita thiersii Skay4041]